MWQNINVWRACILFLIIFLRYKFLNFAPYRDYLFDSSNTFAVWISDSLIDDGEPRSRVRPLIQKVIPGIRYEFEGELLSVLRKAVGLFIASYPPPHRLQKEILSRSPSPPQLCRRHLRLGISHVPHMCCTYVCTLDSGVYRTTFSSVPGKNVARRKRLPTMTMVEIYLRDFVISKI